MTKKVSVIFAVKDEVSRGIAGIRGKLRGFRREAEQLLSNKFVQGFGLGAMVVGIKKVTDAFDEFSKSTIKIAGIAKITGAPLAELNAIAARGRDEFKLSAVQANDLASEMAKLAGKAGDLNQASPALANFLNIGAARGLDAEATLVAVKQAILGIDEGTDKLFDSNPSVLYKRYADSIGIAVGKLTDQQKAQAIVTAAAVDGQKVQTAYGDFLASTLGQQQIAAIKLQDVMIELGKTLDDARQAGIKLFSGTVSGLDKMLKAFQFFVIDQAFGWDELKAKIRSWVADTIILFGEWVRKVGGILDFAIGDRLSKIGIKLIEDGERKAREVATLLEELGIAKLEAQQEVLGITPGGAISKADQRRARAEAAKQAELARQKEARAADDERRKAAEEERKKVLKRVDKLTEGGLIGPSEPSVVDPAERDRQRALEQKGVDRTFDEDAEFAGLKSMPGVLDDVQPIVQDVTDDVSALADAFQSIDDVLGKIGASTADFQAGFTESLAVGIASAKTFGGAVGAIKQALSQTANRFADEQFAKGAAKIAESIFPPNPLAAAAGFAHIAAGHLFRKIAGGGGGGGGSAPARPAAGGGGGLAPTTFQADRAAVSTQGEIVIRARDGARLVDPNSPDFQDLLADTIAAAKDSRRVVLDFDA